MDNRLKRVLNSDPGMGVARHADAGYELAIQTAMNSKLKLPSLKINV
jgi:urocanate hydratase